MRRVLMVCPHGERGGVARVAVALARGLPEHDLEVVTALLARGPLEDELVAAERPGIVLEGRGRQRARGPLSAVRALARLAREQAAALVVTHGTVGQLYGAPAARRAGCPRSGGTTGRVAGSCAGSWQPRCPQLRLCR